jgi:hypothetical protein
MDNQLLNHLHLGIFSRAEQRVLQAIFKAIVDGSGQCVATVAALARDSGTSKRNVGNTVAQAVRLGIIEKQERRRYSALSLPNILTCGQR